MRDRTLVLRAWLASRSVTPAALVAVVVPLLWAGLPFGVIRLRMWQGSPELPVAYPSLIGAATAIVCTVALVPAAAEWEVHPRPKVRRAHALTWLIVVPGLTLLGSGVSVARTASLLPHSSALVAFQLIACGAAAFCVGLAGRTLGAVVAVVLMAGSLLAEQFAGTPWPFPSPRSAPDWLTATAAVVIGAGVLGLTRGIPRWVDRLRTSLPGR